MRKSRSKRQVIRAGNQRRRMLTRILWITVSAALVLGIGYIFWVSFRPSLGRAIPVMADTTHVLEGTDPGPYNSDPPTSGRHYANTYPAGFYDEASPEALAPFPEGFLVHNLEHGYVIFWYNCARLTDGDCDGLKAQIRSVLEVENHLKVIAFPRSNLDVPVVLTSWGQMLELERFDPDRARDFVTRNRNKAPEPEAP